MNNPGMPRWRWILKITWRVYVWTAVVLFTLLLVFWVWVYLVLERSNPLSNLEMRLFGVSGAYVHREGPTRRGQYFHQTAILLYQYYRDRKMPLSEATLFEYLGQPDLVTADGSRRGFLYVFSLTKPNDKAILVEMESGLVRFLGTTDMDSFKDSPFKPFAPEPASTQPAEESRGPRR